MDIQGGHVYDYLHAEAAKSANTDILLTRNTDHFEGLVARVAQP